MWHAAGGGRESPDRERLRLHEGLEERLRDPWILLVDLAFHDHDMHDWKDARAAEVVLFHRPEIRKEPRNVRRALVERRGHRGQHRVELPALEHGVDALISRDHAGANIGCQFELDPRLELGVGRVVTPEVPVEVLGAHAIVVLQEAANPECRGLHELLHADAFALQVRGRADARMRVDPHVLVAETARRVDRNPDEVTVTPGVQHHEGRKRELGGVELGVAALTPERLDRHHREEVKVDPLDGHRAVAESEGAIVEAAGKGDGKFHRDTSRRPTARTIAQSRRDSTCRPGCSPSIFPTRSLGQAPARTSSRLIEVPPWSH